MGKILGIASLLVLAFGFLSFLLVGNIADDPQEEVEVAAPTVENEGTMETAEAEENDEIEEQVVEMKSNAIISDVAYKVDSVQYAKTVADYTSQSGQYAVVEITVTNDSNKAVTINDSDFKYMISDNEYEKDATVTAYYDNGFFLENINPGMSKTASVVYEVPEELSGQKMLKVLPNQFKKDEVAYVLLK